MNKKSIINPPILNEGLEGEKAKLLKTGYEPMSEPKENNTFKSSITAVSIAVSKGRQDTFLDPIYPRGISFLIKVNEFNDFISQKQNIDVMRKNNYENKFKLKSDDSNKETKSKLKERDMSEESLEMLIPSKPKKSYVSESSMALNGEKQFKTNSNTDLEILTSELVVKNSWQKEIEIVEQIDEIDNISTILEENKKINNQIVQAPFKDIKIISETIENKIIEKTSLDPIKDIRDQKILEGSLGVGIKCELYKSNNLYA